MKSIDKNKELPEATRNIIDIIEEEIKNANIDIDRQLKEKFRQSTDNLTQYELGIAEAKSKKKSKFYAEQARQERLILDSIKREIEYKKSIKMDKVMERVLERSSEVALSVALKLI